MRERPSRGSTKATDVELENSLELVIGAAEFGAWNWHIPSGGVHWTAWTSQLFGLGRGSIVTSHESFLRRVHAPDRPAVERWISCALEHRNRTALEFRIDGADHVVRRVRSTGRVIADERGRVVRMAGVVEDVSASRPDGDFGSAVPRSAAKEGAGAFSAREVGEILGVSEITIKRMAIDGELGMFRSSLKNRRRFTPEDVLAWLRENVGDSSDLESALGEGDVRACAAHVFQALQGGTPLEAVLDAGPLCAGSDAPASVVEEVLARIPSMIPDRRRTSARALLVQAGDGERSSAPIRCLLQARGYDVPRAGGNPDPLQLAEMARRVRARFVIFSIGSVSAQARSAALSLASAIADQLGPGVVLAHLEGNAVRLPEGVTPFRSMTELGSLLR